MPATPAVATIGKFDGVHRGHAALLRHLVQRAHELGLTSLVVTFDPHPLRVLRPDLPVRTLTDPQERAALIRALGVDDVWLCPFTPALAELGPEDFVSMVEQRHPIAELWVGPDFALGKDRAGTRDVLERIGRERGFTVHTMPTFRDADDEAVRSSRVHRALEAGAVEDAARLLDRPYRLSGTLREEDGVWQFSPTQGRLVPASGAYRASVDQDGRECPAQVEVDGDGDASRLRVHPTSDDGLQAGPASIAFTQRLDSAGQHRGDHTRPSTVAGERTYC